MRCKAECGRLLQGTILDPLYELCNECYGEAMICYKEILETSNLKEELKKKEDK